MTTGERDTGTDAAEPGAESIDVGHEGKESLLRITLFGLSGQQLVPGVALAGGYLILYSGSASWLSMLIAGLASIFICLAVNYFARRYVVTGSMMSYVGIALGRASQRVVAVSYLVGYAVSCAAMTTSVVIFTSSFLAGIGVGVAAAGWFQALSALVIAVVAGAIAYRGLDSSIAVSLVLGFAALPLVLIVTVGAAIHHGVDLGSQLSLSGASVPHIVTGVTVALAFFVGFDGLASFAAETRDPRRNIPRMLMLVISIGLVSYLIAILLTIPTLTARADDLAAGESPTAVLASAAGVPWLRIPIDLLLVAATFASLITLFNYVARIFATAAVDGYLPRRVQRLHPRFGSPTVAIVILTALSVLIPVGVQLVASAPPLESSTYLFTLYSLFWVIPYAIIGVAAVVEMRRRRETSPVVIVLIGIGVLVFAYLLVSGLGDLGDGVVGALPLVMLGLTIAVLIVFTLTDRRRKAAAAPSPTPETSTEKEPR
jgi:basic amino acid/polyamine antiporter, APA family